MPSKNPDYHKEYIRKHYQANKEYYKNKEKARKASLSREKRMFERTRDVARRKKIPFDLEVSDIVIPDICPVFKTPLIQNHPNFSPSIDKIIPSKGYIKGNIAIISKRANRIKNDASLEEIKLLVEWMESKLSYVATE